MIYQKRLLGQAFLYEGVKTMRYVKSQMKQLVRENERLQQKLQALMTEHDLEKTFALKALYHADVADGGKYQEDYQALDGLR